MDPITIILIVTASVVTYGTGFGATWGMCRIIDRHADEMAAFFVSAIWPLGLPALVAYWAVTRPERSALPPARVLDRKGE